MHILRFVAAAAAFLVCFALGALGVLLVDVLPTSKRIATTGGMDIIQFSPLMGEPLAIVLGAVIGTLLGGAAAFLVWRRLNR